MKITIFYQYFGTPRGSWSTRVYELCTRWVKAGHEVRVVTAPYEKSDIKADGLISRMEIDGIKLIVLNSGDSNRFSFVTRAFKAVQFALLSSWFALRLKSDVIMASSGPITIGLPMIVARKFKKVPSVFEVRDLWPAGGIEMGLITKTWQKKLALWFERKCYSHADLVVTASSGQEAHIKERFPHLATLVIPNASDNVLFGTPAYEYLPESLQSKQIFTHIGSLGLIHNVIFLMRVARWFQEHAPEKEIEIVLIGEGAERTNLESFARKHSLRNVHFLGLKPKTQLPVWVQNSVATLFSTLDNPVQNTCSPNKVFDSFAAGTPVIQTTTGWIYDLIEQEECGINVPPDDVKAFALAMIEIADDAALRHTLSQNARNLAKNDFNRDVLAAKYLTALEGLVKL